MDINKIFHGDCLSVLKTLPDESVDLVFADPPYSNNEKYYTNLLSLLRKKLSNSNGSLLILEHPENINLKNDENIIEERKYGGCSFSFIYL